MSNIDQSHEGIWRLSQIKSWWYAQYDMELDFESSKWTQWFNFSIALSS